MWTMLLGFFGKVPWKAVAVLGVLAGIAFMGYRAYSYHLDMVEQARIDERNAVVIEQNQFRELNEAILLEKANIDKLKVEVTLAEEKIKVKQLERMLLVEHDLNRLLQAKPDMILKRANTGTEAVFKELKEVTE